MVSRIQQFRIRQIETNFRCKSTNCSDWAGTRKRSWPNWDVLTRVTPNRKGGKSNATGRTVPIMLLNGHVFIGLLTSANHREPAER